LHITESLHGLRQVAFITGLVISSPWVFYHIWMFIAAGLYPNEKRLVNVYCRSACSCSLPALLICQFLVMDKAVAAMLWFNDGLGWTRTSAQRVAGLRSDDAGRFRLSFQAPFADDVCTQDRRRQRAGIQRQTAHCLVRHVDLRGGHHAVGRSISMCGCGCRCAAYMSWHSPVHLSGRTDDAVRLEEEEKKEGELVEV